MRYNKEKMEPVVDVRTRDVLLEAACIFCLFYLIAHPSTYEFTKSLNIPKPLYNDPVLVHAFVIGLIHLLMQKMFNKF